MTDTPKITFSIITRLVTYGDNRRFCEHQIVMRLGGRVVGIESGSRRETETRDGCRRSARMRIRELKQRRLFAIRVTPADIKHGDARNCRTCAIAQALWRNQERMGLPKGEWDFEVSPYACFVEAHGIVLHGQSWSQKRETGEDGMPDVVIQDVRHGFYSESMQRWAMDWDDWKDSRGMGLREWREHHGYENDERPIKPQPCSFVLDLDSLVSENSEVAAT